MEAIPSHAQIREHSEVSAFLLDPSELEGIYVNFDVDAILFRYKWDADVDEHFWQELITQVENYQWDKRDEASTNTIRVFERQRPSGGAASGSREQTRVAFNPETRMVVVGWAQADTRDDHASFDETYEGQWADDHFWPKFFKEVASDK